MGLAGGREPLAQTLGKGIRYTTKRRFGEEQKLEALAHVLRLGFTILPVPNDLVFQVAEYKAEYSLSYADCFALACAVRQDAAIVTGDSEFKRVEHLARIHWI